MNRTDRLYMQFNKICGANHFTVQILYLLKYSDVRTQKDIVNSFALPKQTVNTIVNQLEADGYVSFAVDTNDKRNKIISLTPDGQKYAEKLTAPLLQCEANVLQKMGNDNVSFLIQKLQEYSRLLENEINKLQNGLK